MSLQQKAVSTRTGKEVRPYLRSVKATSLEDEIQKDGLPVDPTLNNKRDLYSYFNDEQLDTLVRLTEAELATFAIEHQAQLATFTEYQAEYLRLKEINDNIEFRIEERKILLEQLSRVRNRVKSNDEIRVMRATSHAAKPAQLSTMRIDWTGLARVSLTKMDRFIDVNRLWDVVIQENPEVEKELRRIANKYNSTQWSTKKGWVRSAEMDVSSRREGNRLVMHLGKIGLLEWCDENQKPAEKYLAHFMMSSDKTFTND